MRGCADAAGRLASTGSKGRIAFTKGDEMSSNDALTRDVSHELLWDPRVDDDAITVSAIAGTVTLRGAVGSLGEKREAQRAARRVYGVIAVDNQLEVKLLGLPCRVDADLRS